MIVDMISDLHGFHPTLEGGDLLIIAGDLTASDTHGEYLKFFCWLHQQKYKHYIFIAGNHDTLIQKGEILTSALANTTYLCDSGTEFEGLKIWGSPWTKTFSGMNLHCKAFTCDTDEQLAEKWALIPDDIDILITHSPPLNILDKVEIPHVFTLSDPPTARYEHCGSEALYHFLKYALRPRVHVFGHIHEGYGKYEFFPTYNNKMMISVNASHVNESYQPINKPIRIIL